MSDSDTDGYCDCRKGGIHPLQKYHGVSGCVARTAADICCENRTTCLCMIKLPSAASTTAEGCLLDESNPYTPVNFCGSPSTTTGDASTGGDSGSTTCTDTGFCSPNTSACACGTSCVHYGPGEYMCGFTCGGSTGSADCKKKQNPINGSAYSSCQPGLDTSTMTFDGYCVP